MRPAGNNRGIADQSVQESTAARVLLVTATAGFAHQSIPTARRIMRERIAQGDSGLVVGAVLEDVEALPQLTPSLLAQHDVLCFVHNGGDLPLPEEQKQGLLDFVASGKGFVGVHGASTILYEWAAYAEMLGAHFLKHPPSQV